MPSPSHPSLDRLFVFIMAGGSGERFWPASRNSTPKHLLRLLGEETLLEQTIRRFDGLLPMERIFVLTNTLQKEATLAAIPFLPRKNVVAEPAKRDTAPAAALATALALKERPDAIVALFPADAMIHDTATFQRQILDAALMAANTPTLLTFSIKPTHAATGFGYLELGESLPMSETVGSSGSLGSTGLRKVTRFVEKPELARAEKFVTSGHHGWNAGMFLWQGEVFLSECRRQQPLLADFILGFQKATAPEKFIEENFSKLPRISVDYAIMEKAEQVTAVISEFDWDDVGTWSAMPTHLGIDQNGNTLKSAEGGIITLEATGNIVVSEGKTIALCGVKDLVIIDTADALLICHREAVEQIKNLPLPEALK